MCYVIGKLLKIQACPRERTQNRDKAQELTTKKGWVRPRDPAAKTDGDTEDLEKKWKQQEKGEVGEAPWKPSMRGRETRTAVS